MTKLLRAWLPKVGDTALRKLWEMANDDATPMPERIKLLEYLVSLSVGKPREMTARLEWGSDSETDLTV